MSNIMLAYPNRAGDATYSGGAWSTNLPVTYLATRQLSQVARTASAAAAGSWFYAAGAASMEAGVLALCNHNLTTSAQVRWRGFATNPTASFAVDFMNGNLSPAGWTFTRASTAYYRNAAGLLVSAAINEPRPYYDAALEYRGVLLEGSMSNQLLQSRTPSNASWTKTNVSIGSTTTGADGVANSATIISATAANGICYQAVPSLSTGQMVASVWIKRISGSGNIQISHDGQVTYTTCAVTTSWQRFEASGVPTNAGLHIRIVTSGDSIAIDFAQAEGGHKATMPVVTTTAAASRAVERYVYTPGATEISLQEGTLTATVVQIAPLVTATTLVNVATAGNTNAVSILQAAGASSTNSRFDYTSVSVNQASITSTGAWTVGSVSRVAGSWTTNAVNYNSNGTAGTPDTVASSSAVYATTVELGSNSAAYGALAVQRIEILLAVLGASDLNSKATTGEIAAAYDSGLFDAWPAAWVSGTTSEQRTGIRGITIHRPATAQTYQWWRCDISDASNSAGYVQLGRVFIGSAWSPTLNATYGADIGYSARSSAVVTHGGAEYFDDRPQPRTAAFTFPALTDAEGLGGLLELQRQIGTTREVLFSWNPADTLQMPRRTFLARLSKLSPLRAAAYGLNEASLEVKELL